MSAQEHVGAYRHIDAALVRATAYPDVPVPAWPGLDEADAERWCSWLIRVWADGAVADAVSAASPALASGVAAVCRGHRPATRQARRMSLSLARYLVRMRGRATPFALFTGVAPVRFGSDTLALYTGWPHVRVRADAVWLAGIVARLEACAALWLRLPLVMNDLACVRGDRLVVEWQPHASDATPSGASAVQISVRCNHAAQVVMQAAVDPIPGRDLVEKLAAEIPDAPISVLERVVGALISCGVLITSLRPPSTSADGLGHVVDELRRVPAAAVREVAPLVQELAAIHADLDAEPDTDVQTARAGRRWKAERMRALSRSTGQPLMFDVRLGATLTLPPQVAAEAARAAGALLRLTPYPAGLPAWEDYRAGFVARYGIGALVPVRQLVDVTGLGFPAHYGEPAHAATRGVSRRDELLLALAQQAALDGAHEVVLDDLLDALADDSGDLHAAPHMALIAEVHAPTAAALTAGDFSLAVTGVGRTGVSLTGRFVDLFPDEDRQRITGLFQRLPTGVDGARAAQLSFPPRHPHAENVTRAPRLLPDLLAAAEHRDTDPRRFRLGDLAVMAGLDQLYLVSLSRRCVVEPILTSAASPHIIPPIVRFLFELPRARRAAVSTFSWGPAECLPFLPRLRYGRIVLSPARWRIPAGALPGPDASWRAWRAAMGVVRERLRLPDHVRVGHGDRVLRLSLDEPMDLTLLREHLDRAGPDACVAEAPGVSAYGWFGGRAHEIVVPLASTAPPAAAPAVLSIAGALPLIDVEDGALPGSRVLSAKLYGHPDGFDTILTGSLPELLSAWPEPPPWWFVRYEDPRPHLRLRLHLGADEYGEAADRVGAWAAGLRRRGLTGDLVLDTYHPETARYGSGPALTAVEALFTADSTAVLAQLTGRAGARDVHPRAVTAASMVDLACALAGGVAAGMRWLIDDAGTAPGPPPDRTIVRDVIRLTTPDDPGNVRAISGGPAIAAAWRVRRDAAVTYVRRLATDAGQVRRSSAFASLLHMHQIRAHGIDPAAETACYRAARAVALSWTARQPTTEEPCR